MALRRRSPRWNAVRPRPPATSRTLRAVTTLHLPARPAFVGRSAEIGQLMRRLGSARQGDGQVAVIEGAAGIGKTRLAEEAAARARRRGARVGVGRCWLEGEAPPLWPWRAIL